MLWIWGVREKKGMTHQLEGSAAIVRFIRTKIFSFYVMIWVSNESLCLQYRCRIVYFCYFLTSELLHVSHIVFFLFSSSSGSKWKNFLVCDFFRLNNKNKTASNKERVWAYLSFSWMLLIRKSNKCAVLNWQNNLRLEVKYKI